MTLRTLLLTTVLLLASAGAWAAPLRVDLSASPGNPTSPQMGDHLKFHTVIRNDGANAVDGLIAWISLVQIDKGKEQPVDLEDWSAHKVITAQQLAPGTSLETDWPMRLIQAGSYRVVVSAVSRNGTSLTPSAFVDFKVRKKPVVESQRVIPVAVGIPVLLAGLMLWRRRGW
jgi:hypothetical protein